MLNEAYVQGCETAITKIAEFAGDEFIEKMAGKDPGFFKKLMESTKNMGRKSYDTVATPFSKERMGAKWQHKLQGKTDKGEPTRFAKKWGDKSQDEIDKAISKRVWAARGAAGGAGAGAIGGGIYAGTRDKKRK